MLRRWAEAPLAGVDLTLIVDRPGAVYSGMVPGLVAGDYRREDIKIDVAALARSAGARVVEAPAISLDPVERRIAVAASSSSPRVTAQASGSASVASTAGATVAYDVASLDIGSTIRGLELPGVRELALATRPIGDFVRRVDSTVAACMRERGAAAVRVVLVGGGVAGFELAFTLGSRVRGLGGAAQVSVVSESEQGVAGCTARVARAILREAERRGIGVVCGRRACAVDGAGVRLAAGGGAAQPPLQNAMGARTEHQPRASVAAVTDSPRIDADLVVWATGAAAPPLLAASRLALDERGFARVRATLQVVGHDDLFAAGDCASIDAMARRVPKAGVYAVRQGPILDANLRARLAGGPLRDYHPQRDFLAILNLGERRALATKWSISVTGRLAWLLKDRIDRRFVARYRAAGQPLRRIL